MGGARTALISAVLAGLAVGLGLFTFVYAKGASYLSTEPGVCANCHIMQEHFDAWQRSSHRAAAGCADCHVPHEFIRKYAAKASNGFWHSYYFTTGTFHEPIQINERNRQVTEQSCRYCHQAMVESITVSVPREHFDDEVSCIRCHRSVGHLH